MMAGGGTDEMIIERDERQDGWRERRGWVVGETEWWREMAAGETDGERLRLEMRRWRDYGWRGGDGERLERGERGAGRERQESLKKEWSIVNDMMCGIRHGTSGFDFYSTSNMVTAPDDVWEDYLKSFPHYENCRIIFGNDSATGEDARTPEDAFKDINDVHDSSSTSEPFAVPTEEFDATPTSSRTRTTTADASENQAKKKRNVSNGVYIGDQMVAAAQIMANEISKVTTAIRVEHDLRDSFINAMAEVHELTDVERAIYGNKIMGRVELMAAFMTLQPESRLPWLHAMFN
ncbi:hypothetical protein Syun_001621 [Stephania yunnanensis]|uniref:Myb/SANT-like domain-containing protein n=1 Tax=Stephania yunnanensis TaxID=152371 RepID=A0AAP0QB34_9MAGN